MKVLIVPDKFKGSLTAENVASAIAEAFHECGKDIECVALPLADGGDGTSRILTTFCHGITVPLRVEDPLGRPVDTAYGIDASGKTAFIDMACASGLALLTASERNPLHTSSVGTGQLMRDAVARGISKIILGIGGTATHDGGMGIAHALGTRFLDAAGNTLSPKGKNLGLVHSLNIDGMNGHYGEVEIQVLTDVQNFLCGPQGAARVFAPQKGASPEEVEKLDEGMRYFAEVLQRQFHRSPDFPGAGAGGGVGAVLKTLFNTKFGSGIQFAMQFLRIEEQIRAADIVVTGEGSIDAQTLQGKVVSGVAEICRRYRKPLYVIAGRSELTVSQKEALGVREIFTLSEGGSPASDTMKNACNAVKKCVCNHIQEIAAGAAS